MQAVIAIPDGDSLRRYEGAGEVLTREIAGVPLLIRVIATAQRAGVDSLLLIWPENVDRTIWAKCAQSPILRGLKVTERVAQFDPRNPASWDAIAGRLEDQFLWLPWNWVTHKRALAGLLPSRVRPVAWNSPALLEKGAALYESRTEVTFDPVPGVPITSRSSTGQAERFLVAHSGKPTDGIYSKFNRWLCRPAVRLLTHTPVTPNWVTSGGFLVAIAAAFMYARGFYTSYVAGAVLFFLSGLFDEADGMLARITFRESVFGTWFEGFVDEATYLAVFSGITVGLYRQRGGRELTYGLLLVIGCALSVVVTRLQRKAATAPDRPHEYAGKLNRFLESDSSNTLSRIVRQVHIFIKKGVSIHYLLIFTLAGALPLFLRLAALGANLTWTLGLYFGRRFFRQGNARALEKREMATERVA
jgi:phosphatidylglycerophosphate synthase